MCLAGTRLRLGINSGIGKVTAVQLALKGATVIGSVRTIEKAEFVKSVNPYMKGKIIPLELDLSSLASVRRFVDAFLSLDLPTLDILILNAAVMITPAVLSEDGFELQFATK